MEHGENAKLNEASIKGQNRKTEGSGMVIGSDKKNREGNFELTIRVMYSSRISGHKLTFNSNNELINILDYGYSMDGNPPDVKGSGSGKSVKLDKRKNNYLYYQTYFTSTHKQDLQTSSKSKRISK